MENKVPSFKEHLNEHNAINEKHDHNYLKDALTNARHAAKSLMRKGKAYEKEAYSNALHYIQLAEKELNDL